ncbi:YihY/virulence factor BrkB family protein [Thermovibrio ammonificans]|jgi:membrane protein|uniref:Ribonuclease BN n=1 Tax=Thermovibrio ammonificans (strain DSM 15698 / JCM 12110 / HB-1) TaxID=648996 RepID=E8T3E1_THEA1|nr:YihY/virulence factor BrkB family protein [Thermovibrio ammonificans]ADU97273.1 ribonuclease BN [Thermovibrio ammonificans HB-1]
MICRKLLKKPSFTRFVAFALCDTFERDYQFFAASVAYYTLMSIVPLFIFLFFLGMEVFHVDFKQFIPQQFLNSPLRPIFEQIEDVVSNSGIISGTAAAVMLWFSRGIFLSLEKSFSEILGRENPAGFLYRHIVIILVIFLLWILMFFFYVAQYLLAILLPQVPELSFLSSLLVPVLLFLVLFGVYYFLLPVKVPMGFVFKVSTFVFLLLALFERFFVWFIVHVSKVSILYGSFAAVIIFLLWIYYSATVILIGVGIFKAKLIVEGELQ